MNKNVAKDINKWVKENVSSNNINVDVYGKVWNYANSKKISYKNKNKDFKGGEDWAIGKPEDKTTSEELGDHVKSMYHEIMSSENLPGADKIIKEINDKLDIYSVNTVKTLQKKYNTNDPDQYKKAQQEFKTIISKKHHELYNDSKELKNIENGVWKALESRFGGVLEDKMRAEAENAALPSWITSFESPEIRNAYVTAAIKFPKAKVEENILHQGIFLYKAKKELSELEKDPEGTYYAPTGFNEQGIEIKVPAGSNYDRIQFLKKDIADINKNIAFNIGEQDEYQEKLSAIRTPSIFGKDISDPDLTLDEWRGMLGDQIVQMITSVFTGGYSTYVQEAGAAGIEIIKLEAAKKAFPIKDFLPSTFDQIEGKNLGFSTVSDEDAKRMHFEYALEQFDKLPLEDIVVNGRLKSGRAALMLDILNKGEANLNPAMAVGAINSGLDLVSNFFVISKGLKAFAPRGLGRDLLKGQFDKFLTNGYKELGKGILASSFVEWGTETAQEGASITGVGAATGYWGNYEKNLKRFAEAGGQALLTTGPLVGAGKITTTVSKEITAKIEAIRDPNATRNAINKEKSMWNEKYEDGEITLDERDDIYTELEANEDIVNNTKFKNLDIDAKGIVIRNLKAHKRNETQITKLQEENKKIKDNNQGGLGNSSTLQNEIKIYNLQKDNQSLAQKNLNEVFKNDYIENGVRFAQWINEQTEGDLANKNVMTFDTVEQFKSWLDSSGFKEIDGVWTKNGKNIGYFDSDGVYVDPINNVINGTVNGANFASDNLAIMVNENVKANIDKYSDWSSSNVVHHEVFHFITEGMNTSELQSIRQAVDKELKASTDPKIKLAMLYHAEKMALYTGDKRTREYNDEYFAVLSDALNAIEVSDLSLETGITWNNIGKVLGGFFQQKTKSGFDFGKFDAQNTLEFIKKYNSFNGKSRITLPKMPRGRTNVQPEEKKDVENLNFTKAKSSKLVVSKEEAKNAKFSSALESINNLIPSDIKTKEDYQEFIRDRKRFAPLGKALEENGVISNYVKSKSVGDEYVDAMESVTDRVIGLRGIFNPERLRKDGTKVGKEAFGEFIFANTNFAKRDAKKALAIRKIESDKTTSIDTKEVREIEDQSTINESTSKRSDGDTKKTNVLNFTGVSNKINELMDVVDIMPVGSNTFKTVDEYTGKAAEIIFDIPAEKATKGNKNLSHKTKVVNGMMELSQAGKIQDFFRVGDNLEKLVKIMVPENVTSKTADISEVGENIDVARDIYGRSIGLKGKVLEYFFDKTGKRSQGLTTQPSVWELKPEFKNPSKETLDKLRSDLGITPQGQANVSDRAFNGQLLKGVAEYQAYQTALSITQRKLDAIKQEAATKEEKSAISQDIANVTAAQSKAAFSAAIKLRDADSFKATYQVTLEQLGDMIGYKLARNKKVDRINSKGKEDFYQTRDLDALLVIYGKETGETIKQGGIRVVSDFLNINPEFRGLLRTTLTGGETKSGGFFQTTEVFDELFPATDVEQIAGREKYTTSEYTPGGFNQKYLETYDSLDENKKLDALYDFFKAVEEHLKGKPNNAWFFLELIRDTSKHQNTLTRVLAPFGFWPVYKDGNVVIDEKVTEEHTDPQNLIGKSGLAGAIFGEVDFVFKVIRQSYMQGPLLNSKKFPHDKIVNAAGFMQSMPNIYYEKIVPRILSEELNLPSGYASIVRLAYAVHPKTGQRIDLNMYMLGEVGMTTTQYFGVDGISDIAVQNKLIVDFLAGDVTRGEIDAMKKVPFSKNIETGKKTSAAVSFSRTVNPAKGISVLDFDDTLATTKSGVRYTLPNPDGTPQPKKKVIFMAGGPGSGKSNVINQLGLKGQGFKVVNQDISLEWLMKNHGMPTDMREFTPEQASEFGKLSAQAREIALKKRIKYQGEGDGVVIDGTGASLNVMKKNIQDFKIRVMMCK
jgi:hypothetical protein